MEFNFRYGSIMAGSVASLGYFYAGHLHFTGGGKMGQDFETMDLFTENQGQILLRNGFPDTFSKNFYPVAFLTIAKLGYRFLLTSVDPADHRYAYGLSDYDTDLRVGRIDMQHLFLLTNTPDVVLDSRHKFKGKYPLAVYCMVAQEYGTMVTEDTYEADRKLFEKYNTGRNKIVSEDLNNLHNQLVWK